MECPVVTPALQVVTCKTSSSGSTARVTSSSPQHAVDTTESVTIASSQPAEDTTDGKGDVTVEEQTKGTTTSLELETTSTEEPKTTVVSQTEVLKTTTTPKPTEIGCPELNGTLKLEPTTDVNGLAVFSCVLSDMPANDIEVQMTYTLQGDSKKWKRVITNPEKAASLPVAQMKVQLYDKKVCFKAKLISLCYCGGDVYVLLCWYVKEQETKIIIMHMSTAPSSHVCKELMAYYKYSCTIISSH